MTEWHRAESAYRRRVLRWLLLAVAVAAALLWQLHGWTQDVALHLRDVSPEVAKAWLRVLLGGLGIAIALPLIALGRSLRRFADASRAEGRLPPARWRTLRDVRVLRGAVAERWWRRVARAATLAQALAGIALGLALWAWWRYS